MCVLEECPRTTEDCRRAAQRIEEELSLAEEEVAFVSLSFFVSRAASTMCSVIQMARWPKQLCKLQHCETRKLDRVLCLVVLSEVKT